MKIMLYFFTFVFMLLIRTSVSEKQAECRNDTNFFSENGAMLNPTLEEYEAALVLLLGFGVFAILMAIAYNLIRRYVFQDVQNVDSSFDAGGSVSATLTAVTVAAQLLWPGDLMQSATFAVKYGVAGGFWYCAGPIVNMALFPMLSFKFKTRAPGAKTYLQIILSRFGHPTHILFCFYALLLNTVIMSTLLVGGIAVMQATIKDVSPEFCLLTIVTLSGSYSLIGGLGSTFYVSYFNVTITFVVLIVLAVKIIFAEVQPFGSLEEIYNNINCMPYIPGNLGGSRFTFVSEDSVILAAQVLFLVTSIVVCDQANWQSRVAAKPLPGAIGLLLGTFLWFAVPASIGLVAGVTYVSETAKNQSMALSLGQIDSGIVSTYMAEKALGSNGVYMMLIMIAMLTMSTGSSEIMGISSIIVYNIYQTYINPYRRWLPSAACILCGKTQGNLDAPKTDIDTSQKDTELMCKCPSVMSCEDCKTDLQNLHQESKFPGKIMIHRCPHHGHFRTYQASLINVKSWCVLWVSLAMVPLGMLLFAVGLDLNWLMITGAILLVPSFPGVVMSIMWVKATSIGLIAGSMMGFCVGITANLLFAYMYYDGEGGFFIATSMPYSVLAGSGLSMVVSLVFTTLISLCTTKIKTEKDRDEVWQKLRNIDNPLHPWSSEFAEDFPEHGGLYRPTNEQLEYISRHGRIVSIVGFVLFFVVFIVSIPAAMSSLEVLSFDEFYDWTIAISVWLIFAAVILIVFTPLEEIYTILKAVRSYSGTQEDGNKKIEEASQGVSKNGDHCERNDNLPNGQDNKAFHADEADADKSPFSTTIKVDK